VKAPLALLKCQSVLGIPIRQDIGVEVDESELEEEDQVLDIPNQYGQPVFYKIKPKRSKA